MSKTDNTDAFNNLMQMKTATVFGKDYLDTKNHHSKHIRDLFKDWDTHIYGQEVLRQYDANPNMKYLQEHVEGYEKHLKQHIGKKFVSR